MEKSIKKSEIYSQRIAYTILIVGAVYVIASLVWACIQF